MNKIDFHIHSTNSDGALSLTQLIKLARKKKIPAIAITDHNKTYREIKKYSNIQGIELVSGIEITVTPPEDVKELHVVGLFIDEKNKLLSELSEKNRFQSINTAKKIIKKINEAGYKISFEELEKETKGEHHGRPFMAKILMRKYPEKFQERYQVFDELLGQKGKAFVKPQGTELQQAIKLIHNAGGIAIIAHPWYLGDGMEKIINKFRSLGGDGIEVSCSRSKRIPRGMEKKLRNIARKNKLVISGGSDFHGADSKDHNEEIGTRGISKKEFEYLKSYALKKQK